jgi:peptide methionine sulfoxide reductase MsrA
MGESSRKKVSQFEREKGHIEAVNITFSQKSFVYAICIKQFFVNLYRE